MRGSPSTCSTHLATRISAHWDFSEDTCRTLTAVDGAVMVLDAAAPFSHRWITRR